MPQWYYQSMPELLYLLFVLAFGGCVGSLLNVVAYRMPLGLSIVTPPSRCPKCNTRLAWRDNIPVFGWLLLRGKCRYCRNRISPEYPIVEAAVALLFGVFYVVWYMVPRDAVWMGVPVGLLKPEWTIVARNGFHTWPTFVLMLLMLGALAGMFLVDAKTFMIPLQLSAIPALLGLIVHPLHAAWIAHKGFVSGFGHTEPMGGWAIPIPQGWWWIGASIGAGIGLVIGNLLLHFGLLTRSFHDYQEWEETHLAQQEADAKTAEATGPANAGHETTETTGTTTETVGTTGNAGETEGAPADMWIQYPHARREVIRELLFLAPCLGLFVAGGWLAEAMHIASAPPLWLRVFAGSLMGFLVGGGVVWAIRIFGTLGFGKEAMGLGDVHLMAGVGAVIGIVDASLAPFLAAFVGLGWRIITWIGGSTFPQAMPFGPYLAVAVVLAMLFRHPIEFALSALAGNPVHLP